AMTPESNPLPLHDALPIWIVDRRFRIVRYFATVPGRFRSARRVTEDETALRGTRAAKCQSGSRNGSARLLPGIGQDLILLHIARSEEHTSELQSRENLVCR